MNFYTLLICCYYLSKWYQSEINLSWFWWELANSLCKIIFSSLIIYYSDSILNRPFLKSMQFWPKFKTITILKASQDWTKMELKKIKKDQLGLMYCTYLVIFQHASESNKIFFQRYAHDQKSDFSFHGADFKQKINFRFWLCVQEWFFVVNSFTNWGQPSSGSKDHLSPFFYKAAIETE